MVNKWLPKALVLDELVGGFENLANLQLNRLEPSASGLRQMMIQCGS
jgi:hypothetical protein